ncbi:GNAT family N-acetyltransferase [Peribacillus castrilensis]|uniref:GCN5-like N-acetyltransferase n=1 Tax=Peribacillus simplex TaxID=1478 RepID=A0AAN2PHJ0_9BACI|nr:MULTISPECIES: GNAT family N-acetyltransferase [Bacillaceae]MCP1096666.1 GNAT family N-acetyltransferase [Bacillaceae bacterium OS4b]MCF7622488.1 GNAT family N-acetyltransferase [Peribacillus frigoritolerans]NCT38354.1 GNAT family N-acetyltransferase [Peribacillus frigoritolerans]PRA78432.1 N-acetyltransferase [Peribacillus simplex]CEG32494.1 GCN5-like N-acetyltransferase [Peribacillus simplex]
MLIREVKPEDAESFDWLMKQVETEADFMLMEPGERKGSSEQQRKWLERMDKESNSTVLVAEQEGGQLVGYLAVIGGDTRRTKHSAYLVIGILKEYTGRGIGTKLFQRLEEWAITHNILRLELTVVTQNEAGVSLYKKMGFEIEGIKGNSLMKDDTLFDQYFMSKLLK